MKHFTEITDALLREVSSARVKFPRPDCLLAALTEEVGELAKAMLDESPERIQAEALQVMAMAYRCMTEGDPTLNAYRYAGGEETFPSVGSQYGPLPANWQELVDSRGQA